MGDGLKNLKVDVEKQHAIITDDARLNYMVVPTPPPEELKPLEGDVGCGLCPNTVSSPIDKYDYFVPLTKEDKQSTPHEQPLPISFLQIKDGDVDAGIQWYRHHYPKVPDELVEIMARYNFGDLKYATRKSVRNSGKKLKKKASAAPLQCQGLIVKNQKHIVTFG